jgi:hypothetical protein
MPDRPSRTLSFLREVSVIVLGVAIALGAQALYERGEDSERRRAILRGMRADLAADTASLRAMEGTLAMQRNAASKLLAAATPGRGAGSIERDSVVAYVRESILAPFGVKVSSSYEAMVAGGDIRLLRNAELRRKVVQYYTTPVFAMEEWLPFFLNGAYSDYVRALRAALGGVGYAELMSCPTRALAGGLDCIRLVDLPETAVILGAPGVVTGLSGIQVGGLTAGFLVEDARIAAAELLLLIDEVE